MTWTVVPPVSSTNSNVSDASLTSTESMENPQVLPISVEEEISMDLFNLVLQEDEESGYCIVNQASNGKVDESDSMKDIGNEVDGTEGEGLSKSSTTVSTGIYSNKSPLLGAASGEPSLNLAGNGLVSPNVSLGESFNGTANFPALSFSDEDAAANETNYIYQLVRDDMVELQYEIDLRLAKNLEMKHMKADGNSLFAAVAAQVYGDSDLYDMTRKNCFSFIAQYPDCFSQFVTENFRSSCLRKSLDKVYGEILEARALAYAYRRPVHIYSYSTEPLTVFHPPSAGNSSPIKLSLHYGGHYNSLIELSTEFTSDAGLHGSNPANATGSVEMNLFGAEDTEKEEDGVIAALLNYVAGGSMPIGGSIKFGTGPDGYYNSCELALALGFTHEEVAAAYRQFGEDGTSMLHHLVMNDTYEFRDPFNENDTAAYAI